MRQHPPCRLWLFAVLVAMTSACLTFYFCAYADWAMADAPRGKVLVKIAWLVIVPFGFGRAMGEWWHRHFSNE